MFLSRPYFEVMPAAINKRRGSSQVFVVPASSVVLALMVVVLLPVRMQI